MSKCQKDVKCQKVKHTDYGGGSQKNKFTQWGLMSILTSNMKVTKIVQKHFLCTFWGFLVTIICDIKIDISMCEPHANSFFLWTSSIVHVFDFLTFDTFWQLDIILTIWHLFWHMGNGKCGQMGIMVNTEDRDGVPWGMGHMGGGAHGQCSHVLDHVQLP